MPIPSNLITHTPIPTPRIPMAMHTLLHTASALSPSAIASATSLAWTIPTTIIITITMISLIAMAMMIVAGVIIPSLASEKTLVFHAGETPLAQGPGSWAQWITTSISMSTAVRSIIEEGSSTECNLHI
ncbi:hypothetical protein JVU11DRAFT_1749 [Chiua virens]|nr:hypothetical protein JVU11DRAFT_1749 [Chiua virens]